MDLGTRDNSGQSRVVGVVISYPDPESLTALALVVVAEQVAQVS